MRIKMALASALAYRPQLIVLDEPFSGLDTLVRDEFMEELLGQAGETTVLISTHELGEIENVATHIGLLDEGRLIFEEPAEELSRRFRQVRVTLDREAAVPNQAPADWLQSKTMGNILMFIDSRFSETTIGERVRACLPGVTHIETEPMTLRSIFTTLAREARNGGL